MKFQHIPYLLSSGVFYYKKMDFFGKMCYLYIRGDHYMPKKRIKSIIFSFLLFAGITLNGFTADFSLSGLQKGVSDFSGELAKSLPFNSSLGLNWSDAYIGKLIPSAPPHFGVGGSFGFTTMDLGVVKTLAGYLDYSLPFDMNKMFLPAYTAEARIGGFFLPFDVGFKFGYLPPVGLGGTGMNMNFLLVGGDIRYAVLDGKVLPKISLGFGINYMKAGVGGKAGSEQTFNFDIASDHYYIKLEQPDINLNWDTFALDFKVQISKSILIITPYLGIGGSYAWSSAGYSVDAKVTGDTEKVKEYLNSLNLNGIDINNANISSTVKNSAFNLRVFGGLSFDLSVIRLDLTGLYSFLDQNYGASFGIRFQL